jgi:hypothetical protein
LPFLRATSAFVCAYDISADARKALELQAATANAGSQRLLITSDLDAVRVAGPYNLVVALFGVLSHIEGKETGSISLARYARYLAAKVYFSSRSPMSRSYSSH